MRVRLSKATLNLGRSIVRFEPETAELETGDDAGRRRVEFTIDVENREGSPLVLISAQQSLRTSAGKMFRGTGRTLTLPAKKRSRTSFAFELPLGETPVELTIRSGKLTTAVALST